MFLHTNLSEKVVGHSDQWWRVVRIELMQWRRLEKGSKVDLDSG